MNRHCRWTLAFALLFAIFFTPQAVAATCPTNTPTSLVYGYKVTGCSGTFKTLEAAEDYLRASSSNYDGASLGFPVLSAAPASALYAPLVSVNGSNQLIANQYQIAFLDYRQLGYLGTANGSALPPYPYSPSQILQTGYAVYDWHWPPTQMAAACISPQNFSCSGSPYLPGFCSTLEQERARVQCQFQNTWNKNPSYCYNLAGTATLSGSLPSPNYVIPGTFSDPGGANHVTGIVVSRPTSSTDTTHMVVDVPAQSCTAGGAAASPQTGSTQSTTDSEPAATASGLDIFFAVQQQQAVWCADGSRLTPSGCASSPLKGFIYQNSPKQVKSPCVGDPCYPGNGNSTVTETGFRYGEISFNLYYNSLRELRTYAWIDQNWSASFAQRILTSNLTNGHDNQTQILVVQSDDTLLEQFALVSGSTYRSTNDVGRTLTKNADSTYSLRETSGQIQKFDADGRIVQIQNPDDPRKTLSISYMSASGVADTRYWHVSSVQDGTGRSVSFTYDSAPPNYRLLSIAGDNGQTLVALSYDSLERLSTTTQPDATGSLTASRTYNYGNPALPYHLTGILDEKSQNYFNAQFDDWGRVTASWLGTVQAQRVSLAYTDTATINSASPPVVTAFQSYVDVTMPSGSKATYDYTGGRPYRKPDTINVTDNVPGQGGMEQLFYNAQNQVSKKIDRDNIETDYEYSDTIHLTKTVEAKGTAVERQTVREWQGAADLAPNRIKREQIYNAGGTLETETRWAYNTAGQLAARCQYDPDPSIIPLATNYVCGSATNAPDGVRQWIYTYCATGCPLVGLLQQVNGPRRTTDPGMVGFDDVTTYTYYSATSTSGCGLAGLSSGPCYHRGDLQNVRDALGNVRNVLKYDAWGHPVAMAGPVDVLTAMTYHPRGWLTSRTIGTSTTSFAHDDTGNVTVVTQADGSFVAYGYDDAHRLSSVSDSIGDAIAYSLDALGNRTSEKRLDPSSNLWYWMKRNYDQLGRLSQILNQYDVVLQAFPSSDGYDQNNNPTHSIDAFNTQAKQVYDPLDRLSDVTKDYQGTSTSTGNATTHYTYDARNNLLSVKDPDNLSTTYQYDGLGNLRQTQSPDTGLTIYTPDAAGNRQTETDARNVTTTYTYDATDRLKSITYPTASLNVVYTYDEVASGCFNKGLLTTMTDSSGNTKYCYDSRGNILSKKQTVNGVLLTTAYSYTAADKLSKIIYQSGMEVDYARDGRGLITNVTYYPPGSSSSQVLVSDIDYYAFGPVNQIAFGPVGSGRTLTKGLHTDGSNYYVSSSAADGLSIWYGVDQLGNIRNASTTSNANPPTRNYQLDNLFRVAEVDQSSTVLEKYTYNKTGDRLSSLGAIYAYAPGTHRLTAGDRSYAYDNAGNPSSLTVSGAPVPLTFDNRNRFSSAQYFGYFANYNYNGKGERVSKSTNFQVNQNSIFVYNESGALLGEYSSTGALINEYVYADALPVAVTQSSGQAFYLETDHLGTPRVAVDPVRNVAVWKWDFFGKAFGNDVPNQNPDGDGTNFVLNLRFPGQYYDAETGLSYNYFRDYNPGSGRYIESDPVGLVGGISTYGYLAQRPLEFVDPKGDFASPVHRDISRQALLDPRGCSGHFIQATINASVDYDFEPNSQDPAQAATHGMRQRGQSRENANDQMNVFVDQELAKCTAQGLGFAMHATQDSFARGHADFQEFKGLLRPSMVGHAVGDMTPHIEEMFGAIYASESVFDRFLSLCPCACKR